MKGQKFKQCPKCNFWVEKSEGCDHMSCRCGQMFCYKCGGIYRACECSKRFFIKTPIVRIIGRPIGRIDNIMFGPGAIGVLPGNRPR